MATNDGDGDGHGGGDTTHCATEALKPAICVVLLAFPSGVVLLGFQSVVLLVGCQSVLILAL